MTWRIDGWHIALARAAQGYRPKQYSVVNNGLHDTRATLLALLGHLNNMLLSMEFHPSTVLNPLMTVHMT